MIVKIIEIMKASIAIVIVCPLIVNCFALAAELDMD